MVPVSLQLGYPPWRRREPLPPVGFYSGGRRVVRSLSRLNRRGRLSGRPAPAAAICEWSARRLSVPPGHPDEGSPFVIPDYGQKFLADVYDPEILESLLCLARKQGKSAIVAVLILAHLSDDGPLRRRGWRAGVVSISKLKAGELKLQAQQIAEASSLKGLHFRRSPAPGRPGCRRPHRWEPSRPVYAAWLIFSCSVVKIAK